ncbi:MAG: septum formation initiator family protein [Alistipes sp.]|nr:septum formation initiator family protein [Alistipes sp.]MBQ8652199.1 septum formation initiator family protein [Alistipes sp.]
MKIELSRRFWWITTGIVGLFMLVFVGQNLLHVWQLKRDIARLEAEEEQYLERIAKDSALVEQLSHDDYLEEYAREQFGMQRADEEVFIIK